jgi:hypothetical protein
MPGFVSRTSIAAQTVTIYAQWRRIDDYQAMRQNSDPLPLLREALTIAKFETGIYEVVQTFAPGRRAGLKRCGFVRFAPIAAQDTLAASGVTSCLKSGSSGAWPQPSHDYVARRSAAARQAVPLDRAFCKSQCLRAGLSFLARKCHPLANNGASCLRLGHLDSLSRLFRSSDGALRRLLNWIFLRSPRQKRATAFMHGALHYREAAFRHRGAKAFVRRWLLCVNPNHQHSARAEEIHEPVHRRLERAKRASPPIHKRNVVLTGWTAAIARRCRQQISTPVQLQHQFHALRAGYHDALAR